LGSIFVGKVLMSMYEQPARQGRDDELAPIRPGAWAAWARSRADEQAAEASEAPAAQVGNRVPDPLTSRLASGLRDG
jgi:hypothetical protein